MKKKIEKLTPPKISTYGRTKLGRLPSKAKAPWGPDDPDIITRKTKITIAPAPPKPTRTNTWSHGPW